MDPASLAAVVTVCIGLVGALVAAFKVQSSRIGTLENLVDSLRKEHETCRSENAAFQIRIGILEAEVLHLKNGTA